MGRQQTNYGGAARFVWFGIVFVSVIGRLIFQSDTTRSELDQPSVRSTPAKTAYYFPLTTTAEPEAPTLTSLLPRLTIQDNLNAEVEVTCKVYPAPANKTCEVTRETPSGLGLGTAALQGAALYQFAPPHGSDPTTVRMKFPIHYRAPYGIYHVAKDSPKVTWPSADHQRQAYPPQALAAGDQRQIVIRCGVGADGVISHCYRPFVDASQGQFLEAAQKLFTDARIRFRDEHGGMLVIDRVDIPVSFTIKDGQPAMDLGPGKPFPVDIYSMGSMDKAIPGPPDPPKPGVRAAEAALWPELFAVLMAFGMIGVLVWPRRRAALAPAVG